MCIYHIYLVYRTGVSNLLGGLGHIHFYSNTFCMVIGTLILFFFLIIYIIVIDGFETYVGAILKSTTNRGLDTPDIEH